MLPSYSNPQIMNWIVNAWFAKLKYLWIFFSRLCTPQTLSMNLLLLLYSELLFRKALFGTRMFQPNKYFLQLLELVWCRFLFSFLYFNDFLWTHNFTYTSYFPRLCVKKHTIGAQSARSQGNYNNEEQNCTQLIKKGCSALPVTIAQPNM